MVILPVINKVRVANYIHNGYVTILFLFNIAVITFRIIIFSYTINIAVSGSGCDGDMILDTMLLQSCNLFDFPSFMIVIGSQLGSQKLFISTVSSLPTKKLFVMFLLIVRLNVLTEL